MTFRLRTQADDLFEGITGVKNGSEIFLKIFIVGKRFAPPRILASILKQAHKRSVHPGL